MKVQVLQENLSKTLATVSRFTSSHAQLPLLSNILLSARSNKLIASATNLENSISTTIGAKVEKEGEITIPARIITELVSNLNPGPISLESEKEQLKIIHKGFSSSLMGVVSTDFPSVPQSLDKEAFSLEKKDLVEALSQLLFAVSVDETRPILTGVLFIFNKNSVELVATDGFRLSRKTLEEKSLPKESRVVLPKTILLEVARQSTEVEEISCCFRAKDNQVIFKVGESILSSRIIQGTFPDFEKIIPKNTDLNYLVGKEEFLQAVKLASVFARDSGNVVKLTLKKDGIEISAESATTGSQKTSLEAKLESSVGSHKTADLLEISFNFRFLEEFLQSIKGDSVHLGFNSSDSPGVFTDPNDKNFLHLIMPVKVEA